MFHSQNHAVVHKESATGQEIVAENTANAPLELRIYGASRQEQSTQGKNLLDPHRLLPSNAATTIAINDNVITVTSTWYASIVVNVEKNSDYTIQCGITGSANTVPLRVTDVGDTTRLAALTGSVQTAAFNTAELEQVKVWLYSGNGTEQTAAFTDLQLEAGTVATAYKPFAPNSPSPDYPSEIVSAVDFEVGSNTTATINQPLRGIPDGSGGWAARDYIEVKDGAVRYVKRIDDSVLDETVKLEEQTGAIMAAPIITDITATDLGGALLSMKSVQYYTRIYHNSTLPVELEAVIYRLGRG